MDIDQQRPNGGRQCPLGDLPLAVSCPDLVVEQLQFRLRALGEIARPPRHPVGGAGECTGTDPRDQRRPGSKILDRHVRVVEAGSDGAACAANFALLLSRRR